MGTYVLYASVHASSTKLGLTGAPDITHALLTGPNALDPAQQIILLSKPLPLGTAEAALRDLKAASWWSRMPWPTAAHLGLRLAAMRALSRHGEHSAWKVVDDPECRPELPDEHEVREVQRLLGGRILLEEEAVRLVEEEGEGVLVSHPSDLLEALIVGGWLTRRAAVTRDDAGRYRCLRCGARDRVDIGVCARCGRTDCATCIECVHLGAARACEAVLWAPASISSRWRAKPEQQLLQLRFELSPAQQAAAEALMEAEPPRSLVWAACGAGKTEVVYPLIERTLQQGHNVLFAVPRRDIAAELGKRLREAFPTVPVKALFGGSVRKFEQAPLMVATTHQVLRLYRRFRLVVLDEVDAFPYRGSGTLRRAVDRAMVQEGRLVYMTATPSEGMLRRARSKGWCLVTIPARHHGHPLPEPAFLTHPDIPRLQSDLEKGARRPDIPRELVDLLQRLIRSGHPLLVFVPTVSLVAPTAKLIDTVARSGGHPAADALPLAYGIHSKDPRRDAVRDAFTRGEFPVLIATTVLERGITISKVNAVVLWADYERIFDTATLIQMAGRVGRTREHPFGEVHFVAGRVTQSMVHARARIGELNQLAAERGHLAG